MALKLYATDDVFEGLRKALNTLLEESEQQLRLLNEIRDLLVRETGPKPPPTLPGFGLQRTHLPEPSSSPVDLPSF